MKTLLSLNQAVVPGYYLVCYNYANNPSSTKRAVVPGYYLVCYNWLVLFSKG